MPAIGVNGFNQLPPRPAPKPAPKPAAPPPASTSSGNNPRGVAIAPAPKPTVNDRQAVATSQHFSDAGPTGDYGTKAANTYKASPQYAKAVVSVFKAQPVKQQQVILKGVAANPSTPEAKILLPILRQQSPASGLPGATIAPRAAVGSLLAGITHTGIAENFAKDAWNLAPSTVEGLFTAGKELVTGHPGAAASMFIDPYIQFAEHPVKSFLAHPLDTALLLTGPKHLVGRTAGGIARAGLLGDTAKAAASTVREPLSIGTIAGEPSPITEARSYSPDVLTKAFQTARESVIRKSKGQNPDIAQPSALPAPVAYALNKGIRAKLHRGVDEMTAVHQAEQRGERNLALKTLSKVRPSKAARDIVSFINQRVIRTPETAPEDIRGQVARLRAIQPTLQRRSPELYWNRRQIRDLETAQKTPGAVDEAFKTAQPVHEFVNAQDTQLGAKGFMDPEQMQRSSLFPYAQTHMGAVYNHGLQRLENADGSTLSNKAILEHMQGYRDVQVPNPEAARAASRLANARTVHGIRTQEHAAAAAEHASAQQEFETANRGAAQPTPAEARRISLIQALADRPGTPGEGLAARMRLQQIWAKIASRGGGTPISRDRLTAAEGKLAQAEAARSVSRRGVQQAQRDARRIPESTLEKQKIGPEVPEPSFVEHTMESAGLGRFYKAYRLARGAVGNRPRTGRAFEQGAYDHTWNAMVGQVADRAQSLAKASLHDRVISRYGVTIPNQLLRRLRIPPRDTNDFTPDEAQRIAKAALIDDHGNPIPNAVPLVPIQRAAMSQLDSVRSLQNPSELRNISQLELKALADSIAQTARRTDGTRNVVLVPAEVAQRFAEQYARTDSLLRSVGRVTQQFRRVVLPYSTHWMTQIGSEAAIRAIVGGVLHPDYLRTGRMLTKQLAEDAKGRAANAELTQSTFYSGGKLRDAMMGRSGRGQLDVHVPNPNRVALAAKAFPPTRAIIAAHNRYADTITAAMYGLEHNARIMGLGKLAHQEIQSFGFSWRNAVMMQGKSVAEFGEKLKADPALVAKLGREIDDTFGKYGKFTPRQRAMIQSFTPFLPWYLNAARFVLWNLPAKHPVASSLLASLRTTVAQDIKDGKMMPLNVWAMQELARISPWGIFTPPSTRPSTGAALAGQHILDAFLPQLQGSLNALHGSNVFGTGNLTGPHGDVKANTGPAAATAAENMLEAFLPLARYLRLAEAGGKPTYGTSTILSPQVKKGEKAGSPGTVASRIFNPFYSVQSAQANKSAPAYGSAAKKASGGNGQSIIPTKGGGVSGVVIPGSSSGSLSGVVIP